MHTNKKYNKVIEEWRVQAMLSYLYNHIETDTNEELLKTISNYQDFIADNVHEENKIQDQQLKKGKKMVEFICKDIQSVEIGDTVFKVWTENDEKKLKGYQYDSLVFRYIIARKQMAEYERLKSKGDCSPKENNFYDKQANRDIMRFCQILDEVIGEHE